MRRSEDPWRHAPVEELQDQVLPRWFVLTALVLIPAGVAVFVAAFVMADPGGVPVAARRPPPDEGLTNAVGDLAAGDARPVPYDSACPELRGIRIAGTDRDRDLLRRALAGLCNIDLGPVALEAVRAFAEAGGVVRFATFAATGVDSTFAYGQDPPVLYVNARFSRTDPLWIAPLIVHDATVAALGPGDATAAVAARTAELQVCDNLLGTAARSRGCADAAALLGLPDPLAALRDAGYR